MQQMQCRESHAIRLKNWGMVKWFSTCPLDPLHSQLPPSSAVSPSVPHYQLLSLCPQCSISSAFQHVTISTILKKLSLNQPSLSNYHPISLPRFASNTHAGYSHCLDFVSSNSDLDPSNLGPASYTALSKTTDDLTDKSSIQSLLLDLSATFHSIDRALLLQPLQV